MIERTSNKTKYAVIIGRKVLFFLRPPATKKKGYREPILDKKKRFANKAAAEKAKREWEMA